MLYVSRCLAHKGVGIAGARYGVVDTEDGIENLISWSELASMMMSSPLPIKGVDYEWQSITVNGQTRRWPQIVRISVYKGPGTLPRDKITTI